MVYFSGKNFVSVDARISNWPHIKRKQTEPNDFPLQRWNNDISKTKTRNISFSTNSIKHSTRTIAFEYISVLANDQKWQKIDHRWEKNWFPFIRIAFVLLCVVTMQNDVMRKKSKALIMITNIIIANVVFSALFRWIHSMIMDLPPRAALIFRIVWKRCYHIKSIQVQTHIRISKTEKNSTANYLYEAPGNGHKRSVSFVTTRNDVHGTKAIENILFTFPNVARSNDNVCLTVSNCTQKIRCDMSLFIAIKWFHFCFGFE